MPKATVAQLGRRLLDEMTEWPARWQYEESDIPLGEAVVAAVEPFLEDLVDRKVAETTLRRHFGNAWVLGGEIVRAAQMDSTIRRMRGRQLLLRFVDQEGGPLLHGYASESEQRSFDGTCRTLWRFLRTKT